MGQHERAVEVPQIITAECTVQVPREDVQIVEQPVPKVYTEAREVVQAVPKVFTEERMASVPQVKVVEKPIPKIETQVREKIVQKPATLIEEVAHEYEETFPVEVVKERHAGAQQQIVQTAREWVQEVPREAVVVGTGAAIQGGDIEAKETGQSRMKQTVDRDLVLYDAPTTYVERDITYGGTTTYVEPAVVTRDITYGGTTAYVEPTVATRDITYGGTTTYVEPVVATRDTTYGGTTTYVEPTVA